MACRAYKQRKYRMVKLFLIRGVPGSGKSSFAQDLLDSFVVGAICEADYYFTSGHGDYNFDASKLKEAHNYCQELARSNLKIGVSVVVSNTSTTEKEVETYRKIAEEFGAQFISIVVESRHDGKNQHNVPIDKIQQMKQRFSIKL